MKTPSRQVADLRLIQQAGHRQIDAAYAGVGDRIAAIVRRHAEKDGSGALVLSASGLAYAMLEIDRLLEGLEPTLARRIIAAMRAAGEEGGRG